ncbi:protein of unknown function [Methylocaldum szegediense]|uniref:Uncharacterized protein n=1 Tax=Methylocaldum szegediense TaxID=73780 RepID=A0ABM9HYE6_9GAMM|nr:protein of unknown function [Methylocaldum szegediense]
MQAFCGLRNRIQFRELRARTMRSTYSRREIRNLIRNCKIVGLISEDGQDLVVKLKAPVRNDNQRKKPLRFIEKLVAAEV